MLTPIWLLLATAGVAVWSLWRRRFGWCNPWERGTNLVIVLIIFGMLFSDQVLGEWLCDPLHRLLGVWNIEDIISDYCVIAAGAGACHLFIYRVLDRHYVQRWMNRWVLLPGIVSFAILSATFILGKGYAVEEGMDAPPYDGWMQVYKVVVGVVLGYFLILACRVLLLLRREERHRQVASLYLLSCGAGMVLSGVKVWTAILGFYIMPHWIYVIIMSVGISSFCLGALLSWDRRVKHFYSPPSPRQSLPSGGQQ